MQAEFFIEDPYFLSSIVDKESYAAKILNCRGRSKLTVGSEVLTDQFEVIIRVAEILTFTDEVCAQFFGDGAVHGFNYMFEQPYFVVGVKDGVAILSRRGEREEIERVTVPQAEKLRDSVLEFVDTTVRPLSPFVASMIYSRSILGA